MIKWLLAISLQHIYIEELVTIKIYTSQDIVVECNLRHIDILRLARHKEHTVVEEYVTHRSTSLVISILIWQSIRRAETLDAWHSTQTTVDMHLAIHNIVPDRVKRRQQRCITHHRNHISHTRVEICSTNRVTHSLHLLSYRNMSLTILALRRALRLLAELRSTNINKLLRHLGIELIACYAVHLDKCKLNLLMTWSLHNRLAAIVISIALKEYFVYVLCILLRYIQPLALARSLIISHRTLVHMTHIVELVAIHHL